MEPSRVFRLPRKYHIWIIVLGLSLVFWITVAFVSVPLTNTLIHSYLPLKKEGYSLTLDNWLTIPFPIMTSFYLFNVTNAPDVMKNSARPILQEIGPFVYEERRNKTNVVWGDNWFTVSYNQTRTFHFREDLSTPHVSLNESIYHLNVPLASAIEYARRSGDEYFYWAINELINETHSQVFERHAIGDLLFNGFEDPLINETTWLGKYPYDKFGWMYKRNGSSTDGRYTVKTGLGTLGDIGKVVAWNNATTLPGLTGECANFGDASGGDLFPPDGNAGTLQMFVGDTCRPIPLNLATEKSSYPYMTFEGDDSTYATDGTCYCTEDPCPPNGIANISSCVAGSPVYISFPHFLYGDKSLVHQFEGIQPNASRHSFSFQVDTKLGVPSQVSVAMQLNVAIVKNDRFEFTKFQAQPIAYYPCIYFTSTAGLSGGMKSALNFLHFGLPVILIAVPTVLALICLIAITLVSRKIYRLNHYNGEVNDRSRLITPEN